MKSPELRATRNLLSPVSAFSGQGFTGRLSVIKNLTGGVSLVESTNHYDTSDDSPAWTQTRTRPDAATAWTTAWARNITSLTGDPGIIQTSDSTAKIQLPNLHDDITATITIGQTGIDSYSEYTEYGLVREGTGTPGRYGWLGATQRDTDTIAGLTLMGAHLYNPTTGRFLSVDSVPGGNDNAYAYPGDPVNGSDPYGTADVRRYTGSRVDINTNFWHVNSLHNVGYDALARMVKYGRMVKRSPGFRDRDRREYRYTIYEYRVVHGRMYRTGRWITFKFFIDWKPYGKNRGRLVTAYPIMTNTGPPKKFRRWDHGRLVRKSWTPSWVKHSLMIGPPN